MIQIGDIPPGTPVPAFAGSSGPSFSAQATFGGAHAPQFQLPGQQGAPWNQLAGQQDQPAQVRECDDGVCEVMGYGSMLTVEGTGLR